jgi:hypothetical protein
MVSEMVMLAVFCQVACGHRKLAGLGAVDPDVYGACRGCTANERLIK